MDDSQNETGKGAGLAAVVLAATGFSWGFIIVKSVGLSPASLGTYRLIIGAAVLSGIALAWRVPWPRLKLHVLFAGIAFGSHQLVYIAATQMTAISVVTILGATQPLWVALVSRRTVGERPGRALIGYALLAVLGIAVVVWASAGDASRSLAGDLLAVANVVIFTSYFLFSKRARQGGAPTLTFTAGMLWSALIVVAPAMLITGPEVASQIDLALISFLALVPGSGHLLVNWAHTRISATLSSLVLAAVPVLASLWAYLVLGEAFTWLHIIGMAAVAIAIAGGQRAEAQSLKIALRPKPPRL